MQAAGSHGGGSRTRPEVMGRLGQKIAGPAATDAELLSGPGGPNIHRAVGGLSSDGNRANFTQA
jgi:hypothetical protein